MYKYKAPGYPTRELSSSPLPYGPLLSNLLDTGSLWQENLPSLSELHSPSTSRGSPNIITSPGVPRGSPRPKPYDPPGVTLTAKVKIEKLDKKLKKMEQNKTAATRYRQKKRAEQEALTGECKELEMNKILKVAKTKRTPLKTTNLTASS